MALKGSLFGHCLGGATKFGVQSKQVLSVKYILHNLQLTLDHFSSLISSDRVLKKD